MSKLANHIHQRVTTEKGKFVVMCENILAGQEKNFALSEKESQFLADFLETGFEPEQFIENRIIPSIDIFDIAEVQAIESYNENLV
jgi:hypothetical protein